MKEFPPGTIFSEVVNEERYYYVVLSNNRFLGTAGSIIKIDVHVLAELRWRINNGQLDVIRIV